MSRQVAGMRFSELRCREVINEKDCKRLGCVSDLEFCPKTGCIQALIVPGPARICGMFGRDSDIVIPFKCVCQIGEDIILVCIDEKECLTKNCAKDRFKDNFLGF